MAAARRQYRSAETTLTAAWPLPSGWSIRAIDISLGSKPIAFGANSFRAASSIRSTISATRIRRRMVALLDALAKDFVDSGYDRKHLCASFCGAARTKQASKPHEFNQGDVKYFSHQEPRLLSAEQLLDAINQTLSLSQKFGDLPAGTRATQLPAPDVVKVDFLKVFGQPERSTVCACERADDSNLGMAIELFNGPMMHEKLRDAKNRFRVSLEAGRTVEEAVRELYLAAICRPPSQNELNAALQHCAKGDEPAAGLEDVCWALFNTDEFLFQH